MAWDRITQNPNVLAGRATIRGLRITVAHVVNLVADGMTPAEVVAELPDLEEQTCVRRSRTPLPSRRTNSIQFAADPCGFLRMSLLRQDVDFLVGFGQEVVNARTPDGLVRLTTKRDRRKPGADWRLTLERQLVGRRKSDD